MSNNELTLGTITVYVEDLGEWGERNLDRQGAAMLWVRLLQMRKEQQKVSNE